MTEHEPGMNEPVKALEPAYYTDAACFEREKERIFHRSWICIGHTSQLVNAGDYFSFDICDQNLFAIRDREGINHAFFNVCAHRAHQVVRDSGNKRALVCP